MMCILFVYTLLKVVSYYDSSVFSMSMMGFQKKVCGWRVGGWGDPYQQVYFGSFEFFLTLQRPITD